MGHVHRLQGRLLPHTNSKPVQKVPKISCTGTNIPVQSISLWPVHSSGGVYGGDQRVQINGFTEGSQDPQVRLVGLGQISPNLSPTYTNSSTYLSGPTLASQLGGIRIGPQTSLRLCRLPGQPERGQGQTQPRPVADPYSKDTRTTDRTDLSGLAADVPHMAFDNHRKAGQPRLTPYCDT